MKNDDYIKRGDCIEAITKAEKWWWNADDLRNYREIFERIPAADVELVKHGRWIPINRTYPAWWQYGIARHKCSECGSEEMTARKRCPECGAKMEE